MFCRRQDPPTEGAVISDIIDTPFIGRESLREEVKERIKGMCGQARLIQLCGPPMIGKSRVTQQIVVELQQEATDCGITNFVTSIIHARDMDSLEPMKLKLSQIFQFDDQSRDIFFPCLDNFPAENKHICYVIVFDNCESFGNKDLKEDFTHLIYRLLRASTNIVVVLTSVVQFSFPRLNIRSQCLIPVPPLSERESDALLCGTTPDVIIRPKTRGEICRLCHGIPYAIIYVGRKLQEYRQFTPQDVVDILDSRSFDGLEDDLDSEHDRPFQIIREHLRNLGKRLKQIAVIYAYFPATFGEEAARAIGGYERRAEVKSQALVPLQRRSVLEYHGHNGRYEMYPIIRDCFLRTVEINEQSITRRHFAKYFGEFLLSVNGKMRNTSMRRVLRDVEEDWPNVEHLLKEALHCQDMESYSVYMRLCHEVGYFIQKFLPHNGLAFFTAMLAHAEVLQRREDQAVILSCLGSTMANTTRKSHTESLDMLKKALHSIPGGYQMKKLLASMGWIYYQMGNTLKASQYQKKAMNIMAHDVPTHRAIYIDIKVRSHLAISEVFLTNYDMSRTLLNETIADARQKCPHHPQINVMLNTIGLNYNKSGHHVQGLKYFLQSLEARRKNDNLESLVIPLNNVAYSLIDQKRYGESVKYLEEALGIQKELGLGGQNMALTKRQLGRCQYHMGHITRALSYYTESLDLYSRVSPKHFALPSIELRRARCLDILGDKMTAMEICRDIVEEKVKYYEDKSEEQDLVTKEAFERLVGYLDDQSVLQDDYRLRMERCFNQIACTHADRGNRLKAAMFREAAMRSQTVRVARVKERFRLGDVAERKILNSDVIDYRDVTVSRDVIDSCDVTDARDVKRPYSVIPSELEEENLNSDSNETLSKDLNKEDIILNSVINLLPNLNCNIRETERNGQNKDRVFV